MPPCKAYLLPEPDAPTTQELIESLMHCHLKLINGGGFRLSGQEWNVNHRHAGGACQGLHRGARTMPNPSHPTLLRTSGRYGFPTEHILPVHPENYFTDRSGEWVLITSQLGGVVCFSTGPADVVRSPAPF